MRLLTEDRKWMIVSGSAAVTAAVLTRSLLERTWRAVRGRRPPENPVSPRVSWGDAAGWALITGAAVSLTRLLAERGAAAGWRRAAGRYPRALRRRRV